MSRPARRLVLAVTTPMAVNLLLLPQLAGLRDAGWEIHIIYSPGTLDPAVRPLVGGLHPIPMSRSISPALDVVSVGSVVRLLRRLRPVVVVGSTPKAGMISMIAARIARVPVRVFQIRGARWDAEQGRRAAVMKIADRTAARSATHVLAVSDSLADLLAAEGVTRERPIVLGRGGSKGVDTTLFFPDPSYDYAADRPLLGFAGRLSIDKGVGVLVEVMSRLRPLIPGVRLEIAGEVDAAQPIPRELLKRLEEDATIDLIGAVSQADLAVRMRRWDLVVFPSIREGLPNVVIEAGASGVPTVAWDVTGVRDAIDAPLGGRLVRLGDDAALVAAIVDCLRPGTHLDMRAHVTSWTRSAFDAKVLQDLLVSFLDDACSGSRDGRPLE